MKNFVLTKTSISRSMLLIIILAIQDVHFAHCGSLLSRQKAVLHSATTSIVPKKLHFIWLGGKIPMDYFDNIRSFAAANPDYEINIWTDKIMNIEVKIDNHKTDILNSSSFKYTLRDIQTLNQDIPREMKGYLVQEMNGAFPNYAAASDILTH